jgi:hypothetical protein
MTILLKTPVNKYIMSIIFITIYIVIIYIFHVYV